MIEQKSWPEAGAGGGVTIRSHGLSRQGHPRLRDQADRMGGSLFVTWPPQQTDLFGFAVSGQMADTRPDSRAASTQENSSGKGKAFG
jgi:hypothetical protein